MFKKGNSVAGEVIALQKKGFVGNSNLGGTLSFKFDEKGNFVVADKWDEGTAPATLKKLGEKKFQIGQHVVTYK